MRALVTLAIAHLVGCSVVLGIDDPSTAGDDGGGDDVPVRTLKSIVVTPSPLSLPLGVTQQLAAMATYSDSSTDDVTAKTIWDVDGDSVTVTATGLAKAVAEGSSTIKAKLGGVVGDTTAEVGAAAPDHVQFSLGDLTLAQLQSVRLRVRLVLTDGHQQEVTQNVNFSSDHPEVATIGGPGLVIAGSQAGTATISAGAGTATPATVKVTVTSTTCHPVINELTTGNTSAADEWVELYNPCNHAIDVTGWTLVYRGANTTGSLDSTLMMTLTSTMPPGGQMAPGEVRLFSGIDFAGSSDGTWSSPSGIMQQSNGAVGLRAGPKDVGPLIDSVAYGAVAPTHPFIETNPTPAMANGKSASRLPFDGKDGGDNADDFIIVATPTPRALNVQ